MQIVCPDMDHASRQRIVIDPAIVFSDIQCAVVIQIFRAGRTVAVGMAAAADLGVAESAAVGSVRVFGNLTERDVELRSGRGLPWALVPSPWMYISTNNFLEKSTPVGLSTVAIDASFDWFKL